MLEIQRQGAQPCYEQLKQWLRHQIVSGQLKADTAVPDETQLAQSAGVSAMTARRALVELSDEGLLKRVRGKGTFVRGSFSPQPRARRIGVGVISPFARTDPIATFYFRLLHAIQLAAEGCGISLAFRQCVEPIESFVTSLADDKALKALLVLGIDNQKLLRSLERIRKPIVLLDSVQPEGAPAFDEVNYSSYDAVYSAVTALLQVGHRDIGYLRSAGDNAFHAQRQSAYERALTAFGVELRPERTYRVMHCPEAAHAQMTQILKAGDPPTAMLCTDDEMTAAAMIAALEHGLKLPGDLSFVGIGGFDVFTSPTLSTVRLPVQQLGTTAVQILKERLDYPTAPIKRVLIPAEWSPRASSTTPRISG